MNKAKLTILLVAICILLIPLMKERVRASEVDSIRILQILSQEETAIIQGSDGSKKLVKVGDVIRSHEFRVAGSELKEESETKSGVTGSGLRVTEISEGRIVLEERTSKGIETVIIRVEDGKQKIERIRRVGDQEPGFMRPQ